ncbi:MAG: molybdopterin oxidoreductase family protein [Pseudomonadota bacterium]|nr:molybdopterin oxidoreductase family protein [Pseudomonadota bacterium]
MPIDTAFSVCPHDCPSTCALDVEKLAADRIGKVTGADGNRYTAGVVCAKVARYAERVHHPDRLTQPLRRTGVKGDGAYEPISWDDALDELANAFVRAAQRDGAEAVWPYFYAGTMGLVQRDGIERLRHVMKYSRQASTICSTLSAMGWIAGAGTRRGPDIEELAQSDLIVVWGTNPVHTQVNLMHHIARARKERGARLVVVDPYRSATAAMADLHIAPRPGTDGALACALMHVLFRDGFADRDYMVRHADAPAELEAHLQSRTPEWAAAITGLDAGEIEEFARLYGETDRAFIRAGYGFSRSRNGAPNMHAVTCLPTVGGKWRYPGGGAIYAYFDLYHMDMTLIEGRDAIDRSTRVLDQSRIGAVLTGDPRDLGDGPRVTATLIQNTNPMAVAPESALVHAGFARDDLFVCVHEQFMTETALMADIVLPATTFLEHDDLYVSGGHSHLQIGPRVIEPFGEARSNHDVIVALAKRLGAEHEGFEMTAWEMIDRTLKNSGHCSADELKSKRWIDCQPDFETAHFLNGFGHADGKFHFAADWAALGPDHERLSRLPDHCAITDESGDDHPFRLVTAPARNFLNSSFTETDTSLKRERRPTAKMHPEDCDKLGVDTGDPVRIGNKQGSLVVHVDVFDGLQRGIVVVEGIWPNRHFQEGVGINLLTSADVPPPRGGAVFHDTAVWIVSAAREGDETERETEQLQLT